MDMIEDTLVFIVGAGPAGLAISACLTTKSIPFVVVEKEDCCASLWKKRAYDRCHLHLSKEFCSLPLMPHSPEAKKYMPKDDFIRYIDEYVSHFNISPRYGHSVESASFDKTKGKWHIEARVDGVTTKVFSSTFLVVATGENGNSFIPDIPGLWHFKGDILHSSVYKSGFKFQGKNVLVVGCGNSGMEISYDLYNCGANASIVIRNPVHVVTRDMIRVGMHLLKYVRISLVDLMVTLASKIKYGDLSKYGIHQPEYGPFYLKAISGRSPVIDVGTIAKIQHRDIKVMPSISKINEKSVVFEDKVESQVDAIIFATGYTSNACKWLKDYDYILTEKGFPKKSNPYHWKGQNNSYCAGFERRGIQGVSNDAIAIVDDIFAILQTNKLDPLSFSS